jgi:hypothetical protein
MVFLGEMLDQQKRMKRYRVTLDPNDLETSVQQLAEAYDLVSEDLATLRRIVTLYSRPITMYLDETNAILYDNLPLADKFTFDIDTDELVLFRCDLDTITDALIEMAMYLAGFATLMGNEQTWVVEFAIGAWKLVKKRLKRQLGIPVQEQPRAVVGLPPPPDKAPASAPYPFCTLVAHYDLASFHQMVILAARDDVAVYFPPDTHPKVLAVYVYMRRAMQEVAQGLDLGDHETFNTRLVQELQRLQELFSPTDLEPPGWLADPLDEENSAEMLDDPAPRLGLFPDAGPSNRSTPDDSHKDNPFEAFIEQLFSDDDPL